MLLSHKEDAARSKGETHLCMQSLEHKLVGQDLQPPVAARPSFHYHYDDHA